MPSDRLIFFHWMFTDLVKIYIQPGCNKLVEDVNFSSKLDDWLSSFLEKVNQPILLVRRALIFPFAWKQKMCINLYGMDIRKGLVVVIRSLVNLV